MTPGVELPPLRTTLPGLSLLMRTGLGPVNQDG